MRTKSMAILVATALQLTAGIALAQIFFAPYEFTFFEDQVGLIQKDQVRKELKLQPNEVAKLDTALQPIKEKYIKEVSALQKLPINEAKEKYAKFRTAIREESLKAIAASLQPHQLKRLQQIALQQRGPKAFDDKDVQKALELREEQKRRIKEVADEARQEESRALMTGITCQMKQQINERQLAKTIAVLTKDQQTTWQELVGAPFTIRPGPK